MSQLVGKDVGGYVFSAAQRAITFIGVHGLALEQILLITNVTDGVIIYQFNRADRVGSLSGNVLTLTYDTSTMSDTDTLQIVIEGSNVRDEIDLLIGQVKQTNELLFLILQKLEEN